MVKRAYKYRLYPTPEQARNLAQTFGCCRFVYNAALSTRKRAYFEHGIKIKTSQLSAAIPALKKEEGTAWLREVSSVPLQQALRHLDAAYTNFFEGRANYPTFKKKHKGQSATYTDNAFTWRDGLLTLARQKEPLALVWSRPLPEGARISSVTVSKDPSGRYFISLLIEEGIATLPMTEKMVGVDLGLKSLLITSDGETIANPKHLYRSEKKLKRAQRQHAKKKKGSKNRDKARKNVARLHAKVADTRRDYQHKATTRLIRENQVICLEDLHVAGMLKNHCLAKAIADVGWGEIVRQLEYKARWYGRAVVTIDRWEPTSKTCSACGHKLDTLTLDVREWVCPACGVCHDRDINAARNILAAGLAVVSACGESVRPVVSKEAQAALGEAGRLSREGENPPPAEAVGSKSMVWDIASGEVLHAWSGLSGGLFAVTWDLSGEILISGDSNGTIRSWNVSSGECLSTRQSHSGAVQALSVSPDGRMLASSGNDSTIQLRDMESTELLHTLQRDRPYERLNITRTAELTEAQKATLHTLGAIEEIKAEGSPYQPST